MFETNIILDTIFSTIVDYVETRSLKDASMEECCTLSIKIDILITLLDDYIHKHSEIDEEGQRIRESYIYHILYKRFELVSLKNKNDPSLTLFLEDANFVLKTLAGTFRLCRDIYDEKHFNSRSLDALNFLNMLDAKQVLVYKEDKEK